MDCEQEIKKIWESIQMLRDAINNLFINVADLYLENARLKKEMRGDENETESDGDHRGAVH